MVIRFDTTCGGCGKEKAVFGYDRVCHKCKIRGFFKGQIKRNRIEKQITEELRGMKQELKKKLHDEILKEIIEEENDGTSNRKTD